MRRPPRWLLAAASLAFGAMWLVAAGTKVVQPLPAYEFVSMLLGAHGGFLPKAVLVAEVLLEALLGACMVLFVVRGLWVTLGGLALVSAALVVVRQVFTGEVPCGCFPALLETSVDGALVRNGVLGGLLLGLLLWDLLSRRRGAPGAAEASGRATPAP